jgi:hypothetical protein
MWSFHGPSNFAPLIPNSSHHSINYLRMVTDLRSDLQKVHVRLLARRTELEGARFQLHAASQFVSTLSSTR